MTTHASCLLGRFDEALPFAALARATRVPQLGAEHPRILNSAHELAVLLRLLGAPGRALPLARAAAAGRAAAPGAGSSDARASVLCVALIKGDVCAAAALRAAGAKE
jgi:hypothetical protein